MSVIDLDELERQARETKCDDPVPVHREELLFLIRQYRTLSTALDKKTSELSIVRYNFSLFVRCPSCGSQPGRDCDGVGNQGHETRLTEAYSELRKLKGSMFGESV